MPDLGRPVMVRVKFGFAQTIRRGMPSAQDVTALEAIEEALVPELAGHDAELVLVVTGRKAREFIAYARGAEWLQAWGPTVLERWSTRTRPAGVEALSDPDWQTFRSVVPG